MVYFTLWVVFLLIVLLAVPVTALLEKRKQRVAKPQQSDEAVEPTDEAEPLEAEADAEEVAEFSGVDGGDEFSAFDDFK